MPLTRFFHASAVVVVAFLAAASAIDFGGENDATQTAGTVAPGGEPQGSTASSGAGGFGGFGDDNQWMQTASSNNMMISSGSGYQGWSTDAPSAWKPTSGSETRQVTSLAEWVIKAGHRRADTVIRRTDLWEWMEVLNAVVWMRTSSLVAWSAVGRTRLRLNLHRFRTHDDGPDDV